MTPIFESAKRNWFQIIVIILLLLCYSRLGTIQENTFYTAYMVDSSATRIISASEDYLNEIQQNTQNTWTILDDHF